MDSATLRQARWLQVRTAAETAMKLATFTHDKRTRIGVVRDGEVVDLSAVPGLPTDMIGFFNTGTEGMQIARATAANPKVVLPLSSVRLEAPVLNPRKFLGLGGSYESHLKEVAHVMQRP